MTILLLHAAATLYMAGLIWFVQLVHYPLMASVGEAGFAAYERLHQRYTTWAVAPAMLIELLTAVWLVLDTPAGTPPIMVWAGLAMVVMLWVSTALLQVPCHRRLEAGFDAGVHRRLVASNWLRTFLWSARGVIAQLLIV